MYKAYDGHMEAVSPGVTALEQAIHYLDRSLDSGFKTKAFLKALETVRTTDPIELRQRAFEGSLRELPGVGDSTAKVIAQAFAGDNSYLHKLDSETKVPITTAGQAYRNELRGDCHLHSKWSDGGATVDAMVRAAIEVGHEYIVLTDHSPRLTVAHGLNHERLMQQLDEVEQLRERYAPFRILTGIEVDILEDGSLDHSDDVLQQLDIVVASVHSKLKMPHQQMTERMLLAVASPNVDILGHCTGRMIGNIGRDGGPRNESGPDGGPRTRREPSQFDADLVFTACTKFNTAVEINCRPERLDPPEELLARAVELDCLFAINSDAHATGQLEWQPFGCDKAAAAGIALERIINSWPVDQLLSWTREPTIQSLSDLS
jgi:putative hydrolase